MKEQNGKLSRDEFLSFVKAVLKKKSLEENKPLYFEYKLSENGEKEKFSNRFDAFAPEEFSGYQNLVIFEFIDSRTPIAKRIKSLADDYRKNYDATVIFTMTYKSTDAFGYTTTKQLTSKDRLQIENHFYRIGINVLWVKDYSEIPVWLHDLNQVIV